MCDTYYRELHSKGIGAEVKRTPVLTIADEDKLWTTGVLSLDTPEGLIHAVFFYNGKNFCLKGGEEVLPIEENHCHGEWRTKSVL